MTNLIDERDERTRKRKKRKKELDKIITLSNHIDELPNARKLSMNIASLSDNSIRLLDEGFCDNGFLLKKGALEKYLNGKNEKVHGWEWTDEGWKPTEVLNLTDDFVGTVNLGHMDFATFPFIIGEWTRNDLSLKDIGNDRKGIDVGLRLDEDSIFVKELARQPYDIGISSEFWYHEDEEATEELSEMYGINLPVYDEIFIFAYGLVGECGNVNSSGLELKGETMPKEIKKELMAEEEVKVELELEDTEEVTEAIEEVEDKVAELGVEEIDITIDEESEEAEEESNDVLEQSADDDEPEEDDSSDEDEVEEVADESDDEEDEVEETELSFDGVIEELATLRKENAELKEQVKALKKSHRKVNKKLESEYEAKKEFLAKTANLTAELFPNEGEAEKQEEEEAKKLADQRKYYKGDGIAD